MSQLPQGPFERPELTIEHIERLQLDNQKLRNRVKELELRVEDLKRGSDAFKLGGSG